MANTAGGHIILVFLPQTSEEGAPYAWQVWLLNHSPQTIEAEITCLVGSETVISGRLSLAPGVEQDLGTLLHDDLNFTPKFDCRFRLAEPVPGLQPAFEKQLKLRVDSFAKKIRPSVLSGREAVRYVLYDHLPRAHRITPDEKSGLKLKSDANFGKKRESIVSRRAHFNPEFDLHIEKLVKDPSRLQPGEILPLQLSRFERFLNEALQVGVPSVFVIHGEGKGILRDKIHEILDETYPDLPYRNEYHPKYGFGATEIFLQ